MTNAEVVKREKWIALNKQVNSHIKTMKQNEKAGFVADSDYINWLNELIKQRDLLA